MEKEREEKGKRNEVITWMYKEEDDVVNNDLLPAPAPAPAPPAVVSYVDLSLGPIILLLLLLLAVVVVSDLDRGSR